MFRLKGRFVLALTGSALVIAIALVVATLAARGTPPERPLFVDLDAAPASVDAGEQAPLRFAVSPVWSPSRTAAQYYALADHLAETVKKPLRLVQRRTQAELIELLRNGSVQVAILCTGAYLAAARSGTAMDVIAVPLDIDGRPEQHSYVIARADGPIQRADDLAGRAFAFTDPLSLSGYLYPRAWLLAEGKNPDGHFSRTLFTYGDDGNLRAVLDGIVDAAAVDGRVIDHELSRDPKLEHELRIIHKSPAFGMSPVVVLRSVEPTVRRGLQDALLRLGESPSGRKMLAELRLSGFRAAPATLYDTAAQTVALASGGLGARK